MIADPIDAFVAEARTFCAFIASAGALALDERLHAARRRVLELYRAALALPAHPPGGDRGEVGRDVPSPASWAQFGDKESYWLMFDPYDPGDGEPVGGSLTDDLLCIHSDIAGGLALWDASFRAAAVWEWRFSLDIHWGDHAVNALSALHRACKYR